MKTDQTLEQPSESLIDGMFESLFYLYTQALEAGFIELGRQIEGVLDVCKFKAFEAPGPSQCAIDVSMRYQILKGFCALPARGRKQFLEEIHMFESDDGDVVKKRAKLDS